MKKIRISVVVLCLALLLNGCHSFRFATSIEDLISPVSPSGENEEVLSALNNYCEAGYSLKVPSGGNYTTAFVFTDLDSDGQNEALAFYEPSDSLGSVNMAVIQKGEKSWNVVNNIVGEGSGVNRVDFSDLNNDSVDEIIVGWSVISKSDVSNVNVYFRLDDSLTYESYSDSVTGNDFLCADINEDSANDLLIFSTGSVNESPYAELYSFEGKEKYKIGYTKLDSTITSFEKLSVGKTDAGTSVYVDALRADGSSMVTEFIYYSNYYDSIVSPLYSYSTGRTSETTRDDLIYSSDIDGDSVIEIPTDYDDISLPDKLSAQDWVSYKSTIFVHKCYTVSCKRDAYVLIVTDDELEDLTFTYDEEGRELSAFDEDTLCYNIKAVLKSTYDSNSDDFLSYVKIYENSGYVYLARVNSETSYSTDYLADTIRTY